MRCHDRRRCRRQVLPSARIRLEAASSDAAIDIGALEEARAKAVAQRVLFVRRQPRELAEPAG